MASTTYGEEPMPDALKFATIYHANASSAMTLSWILSDMKVPVEEMVKMITQNARDWNG